MIAFPFQRDSEDVAARIVIFHDLYSSRDLVIRNAVQLLTRISDGVSDSFAPTHWSVIIAASDSQVAPETARAALAELCLTYWMPLYSFVRSRGYSVHDAQDLTQSFLFI